MRLRFVLGLGVTADLLLRMGLLQLAPKHALIGTQVTVRARSFGRM